MMAVCNGCRKPRDKISEPEKSEHEPLIHTESVRGFRGLGAIPSRFDKVKPIPNAYYCTECGTVKYWPKGVPE